MQLYSATAAVDIVDFNFPCPVLPHYSLDRKFFLTSRSSCALTNGISHSMPNHSWAD